MFNNFQNNGGYMNGYGYPQPGMQYAQRPQAKMTQTLTPEQIKQLKNNGGTFNLHISQTDMWRAICTHKENGNIVLVENGDGTVTCPICGATFSIVSSDQQTVQDAAKIVSDVLQTIKTMYLDIPEEMATQYFQILPLLEKMPQLYNIAMSNFNKYDNPNQMQAGNSMYGFNALNAITNPAFGMGMPMYQPQPGYQQQPMGYAPMMMPQQNPFGAYPQMPGMMPTVEQAPQTQPATNNAEQPKGNDQQQVVQQKTFNV